MSRLPAKVALWNWRHLRHDTVTITRHAFAQWPRGTITPEDTMRVSTTFVDSTAGHAMFYEAQVAAITSFVL